MFVDLHVQYQTHYAQVQEACKSHQEYDRHRKRHYYHEKIIIINNAANVGIMSCRCSLTVSTICGSWRERSSRKSQSLNTVFMQELLLASGTLSIGQSRGNRKLRARVTKRVFACYRFMVGTEQGTVLLCNRKAKTPTDRVGTAYSGT
jgi:hypothetical protein